MFASSFAHCPPHSPHSLASLTRTLFVLPTCALLSAFHSLALAHTDLQGGGEDKDEDDDEDEDEEDDGQAEEKKERKKAIYILHALLRFSGMEESDIDENDVYIGNMGGKRGAGGLNVMAIKGGGWGQTEDTYFPARITNFSPREKTVDVTFETKTPPSQRFDTETIVEMYNVNLVENIA